jgi:pyroglutamyl-peptidase
MSAARSAGAGRPGTARGDAKPGGAIGEARFVLLTGFGPFGSEPDNPSERVVRALDGTRLPGGTLVRGRVLPVAFDGARAALAAVLAEGVPALALGLGLAGSRREISVERVALNLADAPIPDALGAQPDDRPLSDDGPPARFATLPVKGLVAALRAAGHPAGLSLSAGSYVCNAVLYALLEKLEPLGVPAGFLHLPRAEVWPLERQVEAVRLALATAAAAAAGGPGADLQGLGGAIE